MSPIVAHAVAKVNLMLNILGKTDDGYHKIESVFFFLDDIYDVLKFNMHEEFNDKSGYIKSIPNLKNFIRVAYQILKKHFPSRYIPDVTVTKNLPIEGGVGGGSSDAACFINTVFDLWNLSPGEKMDYIDIFEELGTDTKVFLFKYFTNSRAIYWLGSRKGVLEQINLELPCGSILLVSNKKKLSTKLVYNSFQGPYCKEAGIKNFHFHNSLQDTAIKLEPSLGDVLANIESTNPVFCGVSGSGPTCFGYYDIP
ncbi:MAG: hypothetical protein LBT03_00960 [Holosporales bacterium]|jgi:4-diphosphocytidyl-2-C-methyl-D-erythritol kinase|nr:hypothetical protein [Holosporales bacterium]